MHNPDFIVFKDSQTDVEFIVRNVDRKPINLAGRNLFATLVNYTSGQTMASVPLQVVDAARGICRLTFQPYMVKDIPLGFHRYVVSFMLDNGNAKILNTDQYEAGYGFFEIKYGRELQGIQPQTAKWNQFYAVNQNLYDTYWISPNFKGNLRNGSLDGLHTFAWYMDNFSGSIWAEGSIVEETPTESDWFPIMIEELVETKFARKTGIIPHNVEMNLQWARFKVKFDDTNTGTFNKILFRN